MGQWECHENPLGLTWLNCYNVDHGIKTKVVLLKETPHEALHHG